MATFKVKYCHKIFDIQAVRELSDELLNEAFCLYEMRCQKLAFDSDHVHIILDMGIYGKPALAKMLKGYVAKKLFGFMPWLKQKYFWGFGLWNPAYYIRNVNYMAFYLRYLSKQKYS
ncbi:MAG: transposase [Nanoarchaeota archaeon]